VYTACIFILFISLLWQNRIQWKPFSSAVISITIGFFFIWTCFQYLPLPPSMLAFLSSFRYQIVEETYALNGVQNSWQALSYAPFTSLSWWIFLLSLCAFFSVVTKLFLSRRHLRVLVWIMISVAIVEAVYGLMQALVPSIGVLWVDSVYAYIGNARGTFINRNHFAGFMEMTLPLALGYTMSLGNWKTKKRLKAILASDRFNLMLFFFIASVIMVLSLVFSRSRAGIGGTAIGLLTFIILIRSRAARFPLGFWIMATIFCGLFVMYGSRIGFMRVIDRFLEISTEASRLDVWHDSCAMVKDHPLGVGLDSFNVVFPVYRVTTHGDVFYKYAHNDYLQLLIETGWPGFLALVAAFYIFLGKSGKKIVQLSPQRDPFSFFVGIGAFSGLISIAFHSFFDFNLHIPANCVYFVTLLSMVYLCAWKTEA
jgi:O-antigen ligase